MNNTSTLVRAMSVHGLTAANVVRGQRLLKIQAMATPLLLSQPCGRCVKHRGRDNADLSTWFYQPAIGGIPVNLLACDTHMAAAIRVYCPTPTS